MKKAIAVLFLVIGCSPADPVGVVQPRVFCDTPLGPISSSDYSRGAYRITLHDVAPDKDLVMDTSRCVTVVDK